jgi:hypothetical protein
MKRNIISVSSRGKPFRSFTVIDRAVAKARKEIMDQVDSDLFKVLNNTFFFSK